jgi:hypothetical protein
MMINVQFDIKFEIIIITEYVPMNNLFYATHKYIWGHVLPNTFAYIKLRITRVL